jgi:hypothetical protein
MSFSKTALALGLALLSAAPALSAPARSRPRSPVRPSATGRRPPGVVFHKGPVAGARQDRPIVLPRPTRKPVAVVSGATRAAALLAAARLAAQLQQFEQFAQGLKLQLAFNNPMDAWANAAGLGDFFSVLSQVFSDLGQVFSDFGRAFSDLGKFIKHFFMPADIYRGPDSALGGPLGRLGPQQKQLSGQE